MIPEKHLPFLRSAKAKEYRNIQDAMMISPDTHGVWVHLPYPNTHWWLVELLYVPLNDNDFHHTGRWSDGYQLVEFTGTVPPYAG